MRMSVAVIASLMPLVFFAPRAQAFDSGDLQDAIDNQWIPAWNAMTGQLSAVILQQAFAFGTLFDGKEQLERQRLLEQLSAEAHKDYQSDHQLCRIGTNVRNLAGSEILSDINARFLNNALLEREVLNANSAGAVGMTQDYKNRMEQFKRVYCNVQDNNNSLQNVCTAGQKRENNDIDYTRLIEGHMTLDIDFTNNALTNDEEDILALSKNLFSYNIMKIQKRQLMETVARNEYQDLRSIVAMRSIARNSYARIVGMRAKGTNTLGPYMHNIISALGVPNADLNRFLGQNPSYFAQMEVLTKKMFESPSFFANLYTTPANVERTKVTLMALRLMQDRDRYESSLRRELLISMLLEAKLREHQEMLNNETMNMTDMNIK